MLLAYNSKTSQRNGGGEMKVEYKKVIERRIVAPKGYIILSCGCSEKDDLWNGGDSKEWKPCPMGVDVSCVARVIRKKPKQIY